MVAEIKPKAKPKSKPAIPTSVNGPERKPRHMMPEVGNTGLRRFGGYVSEDFDPQLNGFRAAAAFDEMRRNDPDVAAILSAIEYIIQSVDWTVVPGGTQQADIDAANFLRECMEDTDISWHDLVSDICSMFPFGWALFEIVWKQRNGLAPYGDESESQYDDGRIGWGKIALRGQESLDRWEFADNGDLLGMHQRIIWSPATSNQARIPMIPMEKCALFRVKREKNNPEGWSILRPAYRPYFIKKNIEEIEVQGAEKDMVGTLVIRMPANGTPDDREVALTMLEDYHSGDQTGLLLPRTVNDPTLLELDWQAELMKSPGSKMVDTDKIINRCSVMITRTSLAQFLTLGQNKAGGSRALGESMMEMFQISVNGHLDNIESTANRSLVRPLFKMNAFPGMTKLPQLQHASTGEMALDKLIDAIAKLHNTGFPLNDPDAVNTIRKKIGLPQLDQDFLQERQEIQEQATLAVNTPEWPDVGALSTRRTQQIGDTSTPAPASKAKPDKSGKGGPANPLNKKVVDRKGEPPAQQSINAPARKTASEWREWLASNPVEGHTDGTED